MHTEKDTILVTGAAGFIGYHVAKSLAIQNYHVVGIDNINEYYDPQLKQSRLADLQKYDCFEFRKLDITDLAGMTRLFEEFRFPYVIHLAAQAGVRYSTVNPHAYLESNFHGFLNILEACRHHKIKHLIFASSSSVYGANTRMPFSVHDNVDHPVSLYAASKKCNELMAHSYSTLYDIPSTGLRFFTVYGPYARPDMALFLFTKAIIEGEPINVYNDGNMKRDFTYVDDIAEIILRLIPKVPVKNPAWNSLNPDPATSFAPYRIFNIGNSKPVSLMDMIDVIEKKLGRTARKNLMPLQPGDVVETYADISELVKEVDFIPSTPLEVGVGKFVDWYMDYYRVPR